MTTIICSGCQKKLAVNPETAGKKVKCPACGHVTVFPLQVTAAVGNQGMPQDRPHAAQNALEESPTNPPLDQPDATQGLDADEQDDASLTDFLAPPQAPDELGRLGGFRILKILGHGGMGVVFLGDDPTLGRKVAIKAMLPHLGQSKSSRQRFLREARAAAALEHDNIVAIHHVGEDRGAPYIVMPLLKGQPLDARLRSSLAIPLMDILRIGREIACGLDAAHKTGLIHRDIKPANIWLEVRGEGRGASEGSLIPHPSPLGPRVKILDFGLARPASGDAGLTQQGAIVGTPAYMAPEQGRGESVDARSDLFSLGVVLYRLCTGRQPFHGNDAMSTLVAIATTEPPPPIKLNSELPPELSDLVMKLLEKDSQKRVQTAEEAMRSLQALEKELIRKKEAREHTVALAVPIKPKASLDQALFAVEPTWPSGAGEPSRVSGRVELPQPGPSRGSARRKSVVACAAVFAFLCLLGAGGIVYFLQTNHGIVRVEISDPKIKVVIEGDEFTFTNADKKDIRMKPGKHGLSITRDDFTFDTANFELKRGETVTLKIDWFKDGKLTVLQGEKILGVGKAKMPPAPIVVLPAPIPVSASPALAFDPKNRSRVVIPSWTFQGDHPLTVEAWTVLERPADDPAVEHLLSDAEAAGFVIANDGKAVNGQKWGFHLWLLQKGGYVGVKDKQPLPRNQWVHVAGVYVPESEVRFYVNGKLQESTSAKGTYRPSPVSFTLGANPGLNDQFSEHFLGRMNEVRISKVARYDQDFEPKKRFEPDQDTIALYHFDEGSGDVLRDCSGNKHHGAIVGAKWVKADGFPLPSSPPRFALRYDGKARVEASSLSLPQHGPLCIEAYVTVSAAPDEKKAGTVVRIVGNLQAYLSTKNADLGFVTYTHAPGPPPADVLSRAASFNMPPFGTRFHLAGVRTDTEIRLYLDGKLIDKKPIPRDDLRLPTTAKFAIGFTAFQGLLTEVRVSKAARYVKDFTPAKRFEPDADTLALYHFDEGQGDELKDSSGNRHHGKIVGAQWVNADGTPIAGNNFVSLFNGRDLTGWTALPRGDNAWKVEQGAITCNADDKSFLFTERGDFSDFHLRVEAKINKVGIGGVLFRSKLSMPSRPAGPGEGLDARICATKQKYRTGSLSAYAPTLAPVPPADEWFDMEIIAKGDSVTILVNGQKAGDYHFKRQINTTGHIALQHLVAGTKVYFRKIEIKDPRLDNLPVSKALGPWQPIPLDAKMSQWWVEDNKQANAVTVAGPKGEPVLQMRNSGKGVYVTTKKSFQSNHARLEFQFTGKNHAFMIARYSWGENSKSGVQFYVDRDGKTMANFPWAIANEGQLERGVIAFKAAYKDVDVKFAPVNLEPAGSWNRLDMVRDGDRVAFFVNGRFSGAVTDIRTRGYGKEAPPGNTAINLNCGAGELLVRRVEVRDIDAFRPELIEPGPWQPLLDASLAKWRVNSKPPARVEAKQSNGETMVQLLQGGFFSLKMVVPDHHLRLEFQFPGKQPSLLRGLFGTGTGSSALVFNVKSTGELVMELNNTRATDVVIENGDLVPRGASKNGGTKLGNFDLGPPATWNRLDVVRVGDQCAFFLNGRFVNAVANLRWLEKGKQIEPGNGAFGWSSAGEVLMRRIEIRDIIVLPPELLAPPPAVAPFDAKKAQGYQQLWADHLGRKVEETNSIGMKLRLIPPGEFRMGDGGYGDSLPIRTVRITKAYYVGALEVTRKQYLDVMKDPMRIPKWVLTADPELPMGGVDWDDAVAFCEALSALPAERAAGRRYRLPTEAEWEYACRAGTATRFHFGDSATAKDANFRFDKDKPAPLMKGGSFAANAWGLFDMHGNSREWCADWYSKDFAKFSPLDDPAGPPTGEDRRLTRGGGHNDGPASAGYRLLAQDPASKYGDLGFRVVCEIVPPALASAFPPLDPLWEKAVATMKPEQQIEAVKAELVKRNPDFDGKGVQYKIGDAGEVAELTLPGDAIADISPVRALPQLRRLDCTGTWTSAGTSKLSDLSPLKDMKTLRHLFVGSSRVADLSPLKDLSLWSLNIGNTPVTDLTPLQGMKELNWLTCGFTKISNLTPIKNLPLKSLWAHSAKELDDLAQIQNMKLTSLKIPGTKITDLTPIKGMPLTEIECAFNAERDAAILRSIKTLETINGKTKEAFWKEIDAKKAGSLP